MYARIENASNGVVRTGLLRLAAVVVMASAFVACIPSQAPEDVPAAPPAAPAAAAPAAAAGSAPASPPARPGESSLELSVGNQPQEQGGIALRKREDGPGFDLRGSFGLDGTFVPKHDADTGWLLDATLQFPTGGFEVGQVETIRVSNLIHGPDGIEVEETNDFLIKIPIRVPAPDTPVTQALQGAAVRAEVAAPHDATFIFNYLRMP